MGAASAILLSACGLGVVNAEGLYLDNGVTRFWHRIGQRFDDQTVQTAESLKHDCHASDTSIL